RLSILTDDYANYPTGWREINPIGGFNGTSIPGLSCAGTIYQDFPGIIGYIGDTVYAYDAAPCGGPNHIIKLYVPQDRRINPATDYSVEVIGDHPGQGLPQTFGRSSNSQLYDLVVTEPIGGVFQYFTRTASQGNIYSQPDFLWTYDPREMPANEFSGMLPFRTERVVMDGKLYYIGTDGTNGFELWKSDGTPSGTEMVKNIDSGNLLSSGAYKEFPSNLTVGPGNTLYFTARNQFGYELWKSDGTSGGTELAVDINTSTCYGCNAADQTDDSNPNYLTIIGDVLFFSAQTDAGGTELYKVNVASAATATSATMVADINTTGSSNPEYFTVVGNTLFFTATASGDENNRELYRVDATSFASASSATLVATINAAANSSIDNLTAVGSTLFFSADDGINGVELWKSDGTGSGTIIVENINPTGSSNPNHLYTFSGALYFAADDGTNGVEIWKSSGAFDAVNTSLFADINGVAGEGSYPSQFTEVNGNLFFRAADTFDVYRNFELYRTDGTIAPIELEINTSTERGSSPQYLTAVGTDLYFRANDGTNGNEVFRLPSPYTTATLIDINPAGDSDPVSFISDGTSLYLTADDGTNGFELWEINGTV
ncbi:MAG: hypothetical protein HRU12_24400, partial [Phaeodactylibacter sp.]|nr:hypothetical protein [Phaeodactylibacter sp.]